MTATEDIAARFARDTAHHQMRVLHDDGVYRHVRFMHTTDEGRSSAYWFELVTWPGSLVFRGDGQSFVFERVEDMFAFFRDGAYRGEPSVSYWAEKVTSGQDRIRTYSEEMFRRRVLETFTEDASYGGVPRGTGRALREQILDNPEIYHEQGARDALDEFEHDGYEFVDTWDWDILDWDWWFLWACHALVWGIAYYDKGSRPEAAERPAEKAPRHAKRERPARRVIAPSEPEPVYLPATTRPNRRAAFRGRSVVDVQLPEPADTATQ